MKTTNGFKLWQIIYPIGLYYVVSSLVYFALEFILGTADDTYMLRQLICSAATIPFLVSFYRQDLASEKVVYGEKKWRFDLIFIKNMVAAILITGTAGIAVNNIIAMTPLMEVSKSFQEANAGFFGGAVVFELLGSCLIVPIAEELLFRGLVYKRIRLYWGSRAAIVGSALLFGIMHVNLVQFIYAFALGLILAVLVEKTGCFYTAVIGHIAANVIAIVRAETGFLDFSYQSDVAGILFTAFMLLIMGGMLVLLLRKENNK